MASDEGAGGGGGGGAGGGEADGERLTRVGGVDWRPLTGLADWARALAGTRPDAGRDEELGCADVGRGERTPPGGAGVLVTRALRDDINGELVWPLRKDCGTGLLVTVEPCKKKTQSLFKTKKPTYF